MIDKQSLEQLQQEANALCQTVSKILNDYFQKRPHETEEEKCINELIVSAVIKSLYFRCLFHYFENGHKCEYSEMMNADFEKFWSEHKLYEDYKKL
jgi:hypothetical protein